LDEKEVSGIAKSIAKWTHSKLTEELFNDYIRLTHEPEIQSIRGKKSRGGGRKNILGSPWISLGISRATWYRKSKSRLIPEDK